PRRRGCAARRRSDERFVSTQFRAQDRLALRRNCPRRLTMALRIIFMGTPDFSVPTLEALAEAGHDIVAVYSQPPRPAGRRGLELVKSPVHRAAERRGIPVFTPADFRDEADRAAFRA